MNMYDRQSSPEVLESEWVTVTHIHLVLRSRQLDKENRGARNQMFQFHSRMNYDSPEIRIMKETN